MGLYASQSRAADATVYFADKAMHGDLSNDGSAWKLDGKPFEPALELSIIQGIQTDKKIFLGYGPREFGSDTLDVELEETTAPPIAFEIVPTNIGIEFGHQTVEQRRINPVWRQQRFIEGAAAFLIEIQGRSAE